MSRLWSALGHGSKTMNRFQLPASATNGLTPAPLDHAQGVCEAYKEIVRSCPCSCNDLDLLGWAEGHVITPVKSEALRNMMMTTKQQQQQQNGTKTDDDNNSGNDAIT